MNKQLVYEVRSIKLTRIGTQPEQVNISAYGIAVSPNWTKAQLSPFIYVQAPPDGIYDFNLVATPPPGGVGLQVLTPLPEPGSLTEFIPENFRGVRIHALADTLEALLGPEAAAGGRVEDAQSTLVTHLKAMLGALREGAGTNSIEAKNCEQACHDTLMRELDRCKDLSCVTRVMGQYVVCINKCRHQA